MGSYKVLISEAARQMLKEHIYFLAAVNVPAARKLQRTLYDSIQSLAEFPERFPYLEPDNKRSAYRKMYVPNNYLIIYTVERQTVYVEYILDCRQDYQWLINKN
jgi:plasmid stabilization system protein ParE